MTWASVEMDALLHGHDKHEGDHAAPVRSPWMTFSSSARVKRLWRRHGRPTSLKQWAKTMEYYDEGVADWLHAKRHPGWWRIPVGMPTYRVDTRRATTWAWSMPSP